MTMAATEWERKRLRDLPLQIIDGDRSARYPKRSEFRDSGILFLNTTNIVDDRLDLNEAVYISEQKYSEIKKGRAQRGDIFMTTRGSIGKVARFDCEHETALINAQILILRADPNQLDSRFLFHTLRSPLFKTHLANFASGSAQPQIPITDLREVDLPIPPLPVQRRIAGILSAYDELMENSQRRIRILEAMARALYREWFVHFRFPGNEKLPRVESPLGEIPKGWEVKRVLDCVHVNPRIVVPRNGEKPFVPMGCLSNDSMLITDIESREGNSGAKFQNGDTLFARITPCLENGKTGFVQFLPDAQPVAFGSTEFIVLRSHTLTPEFVYCLARSDEFRGIAIKSMSGATGRQRVQEKCFNDFQITQPPLALLDRFTAIVAPSFRLIYKLHLQIRNLRLTRDLLLPRLLSGQVKLTVN